VSALDAIDLREIGAVVRRVSPPQALSSAELEVLHAARIQISREDPYAIYDDPNRERAERLVRELERAGFEIRRST
jgi:hypothetical protein